MKILYPNFSLNKNKTKFLKILLYFLLFLKVKLLNVRHLFDYLKLKYLYTLKEIKRPIYTARNKKIINNNFIVSENL